METDPETQENKIVATGGEKQAKTIKRYKQLGIKKFQGYKIQHIECS